MVPTLGSRETHLAAENQASVFLSPGLTGCETGTMFHIVVFNSRIIRGSRLTASFEDSKRMTARLVALDEGPDILLDQTMIVVGRHPSCDARLASLRLSRRHCCLTQENGEIVVRDLGSTNGIRINGAK